MTDRTAPPTGVVVGVDGQPATIRAVSWAAREASRYGVALDLVQVVPPAGGASLRGPDRGAQALLDRAHRAAEEVGELTVRASVVDGEVGPALGRVAEHALLLVVGSRTPDSSLDVSVGPVVAHLLVRSTCPLVVVPPRWSVGEGWGSIVVGVDDSTEALGAVAFAADAADRCRTSLTAVTVEPRRSWPDDDAAAHRLLAESVAALSGHHPDVAVTELVRHGGASSELIAAGRHGVRLVVLGTRDRRGETTLLGSTSRAVVRFAPCPIAVLPPIAARRWLELAGGHEPATRRSPDRVSP